MLCLKKFENRLKNKADLSGREKSVDVPEKDKRKSIWRESGLIDSRSACLYRRE